MSKKVFLDTNIILDLLDDQRDGHENVQLLMQYLILNNFIITISEDMLSTIFYIDRRNKKALNFFKTIIHKWKIVPYGIPLIEEAIEIAIKNDLDLEDLLQCLSAKDNGCEVLITEDKAFVDCGIEVLSVEEFLAGEKNG